MLEYFVHHSLSLGSGVVDGSLPEAATIREQVCSGCDAVQRFMVQAVFGVPAGERTLAGRAAS